MDLLEAFCELAPLIGDPEVDARREAAAAIIHRELSRIARMQSRFSDTAASYADDIVDIVCERLIRAGPRDCEGSTEGMVRRYLWVGVMNCVRDSWRSDHRGTVGGIPGRPITTVRIGGDDVPITDILSDDDQRKPDAYAHLVDVQRLWAQLVDRAVARRTGPTGLDLRAVIAKMLDAVIGSASVEDLARNEFDMPRAELPSADQKMLSDRLYQRHHRARQALIKEIDAWESGAEGSYEAPLDAEEAEWLRSIVRALKLGFGGARAREELAAQAPESGADPMAV